MFAQSFGSIVHSQTLLFQKLLLPESEVLILPNLTLPLTILLMISAELGQQQSLREQPLRKQRQQPTSAPAEICLFIQRKFREKTRPEKSADLAFVASDKSRQQKRSLHRTRADSCIQSSSKFITS